MAECWLSVPIPGYERYRVSDLGRVRGVRGRILRQTPNQDNYLYVRLHNGRKESRCMYVHRLVFLAFEGELPEGWEVHHDDRNRRNNRRDNLVGLENDEAHWNCHKPRPEPGRAKETA